MEDERKMDFEPETAPDIVEEALIKATQELLCPQCRYLRGDALLHCPGGCDTHDRLRHRLEGLLT